MNILAIESSCDETAAAVVIDGVNVLSSVVASSLKEHAPYGGIIPEIASRRQIELIDPVVNQALSQAGLDLKAIDAIAVTARPGLIGSLLVGVSYARALAFATHKPLIEIDHIQAHLYASFLSNSEHQGLSFNQLPAIGLVVSGGHTSLYLMKTPSDQQVLGTTQDDAAGEAFDKVARLLNLGYPGGPVIDRLAKEAVGQPIKFPQAKLHNEYDFSFSGLKTAVLYYYQKHHQQPDFNLAQVVHGFQDSVVKTLVEKTIKAAKTFKVRTIVVGGGVACNSHLRQQLTSQAQGNGLQAHFPLLAYCLDNAAMIGGLAFHYCNKTIKN